MGELGHHVLLTIAVCALGASAVRVASAAAPSGAERVIAAAVLATAAAVLEALALGVAGLGSSPPALAVGATVTWVLTASLADAPGLGVLEEMGALLARTGAGRRIALGAVLGGLAGAAGFFLAHPDLSIDGVTYHLPEILGFIHGGHPGAVLAPTPEFQTGWYPLTNETVLAWAMGISASYTPIAVWMAALLGLLVLAGYAGLRRLGVPVALAALALGAVMLSPDFLRVVNTPKSDIPALAWMVCSAYLVLAAVDDRPRLYAIAVLAGGLSVGSKTTTAVLVGAVLIAGASRMRTWAPRALAAAGAATVVVGGLWYLRDLAVHGSPFWPLVSTPWGDAVPSYIARVHGSFLQRPGATLDGRVHSYLDLIAGNLILLGGGVLAAALERRRAVLAASTATLASALLWAGTPFTGIAPDRVLDLSLFVTRYLMPAVMCGALALALAGRGGRRRAILCGALLGPALAWNLWRSTQLPFPEVPSGGWALGGALVGGASLLAAGIWLARGRLAGVGPVRGAWAVTVAAATVGLALSAHGYVTRHGQTNSTFESPVLRYFTAQPAFVHGSTPIAVAPQQMATLAGDDLRHDVQLIGTRETCGQILARTRREWVVVRVLAGYILRLLAPAPAQACLARQQTVFRGGDMWVYGGPRP